MSESSSKYATLTPKDLQKQIQSILEPRVLLAEDEFAHAVSLSRSAVAVWRGIDALEKHGEVNTLLAKELSEIKDALEIALSEDDENLLQGVEKDLSRLLKQYNVGVDTVSGTSLGVGAGESLGSEAGRSNLPRKGFLGAWRRKHGEVSRLSGEAPTETFRGMPGETAAGVARDTGTSASASASGAALTTAAVTSAAIKAPGQSTPGPFRDTGFFGALGLGGFREGKSSTYQKAVCLSAVAWLFVITGCAIAIALLTRNYINKNDASFKQIDRERVGSLDMPQLTFCHIADNVPAFFDRTDGVLGEPTLGIGFLQNLETNENIKYPKTRDLFEEVVIARGNEEQRNACMKRMTTFDSSSLKERKSRDAEVPTCRACLRTRSNVSFALSNPDTRAESAAQRAGVIYDVVTMRFLTFCLRAERPDQFQGMVDAVRAKILQNIKGLVAKKVIDFNTLRKCTYDTEEKLDEIFKKRSEASEFDPNLGNHFGFLCNVMFFSGYFYPNGGEMQSWKFFPENGTFIHTGGAPPFEVKVEQPRAQIPSGLPEPEEAHGAPEGISDGPGDQGSDADAGGQPEAPALDGDGPPGGEPPDDGPDGEFPEDGPPADGVPEDGGPGDGAFDDGPVDEHPLYPEPCIYDPLLEDPPGRPLNLSAGVLEPLPSNIGNFAYQPYVTIYSKSRNIDESSRKPVIDVEPANVLERISADSEMSISIERESEVEESRVEPRYRPQRVDILRIGTQDGSTQQEVIGYYYYLVRVSFENFFRESLVPRSTYQLSRYLADVLNMLGIFLGLSIFACLLMPASRYLIKKGVSRNG